VSAAEPIVRLAAKGDGVTTSGRHVAGAVTGDLVAQDGSLESGPHHVDPPCSHFARCGGCQLQHADETVLKDFVTQRVVNAAAGQGIAPDLLEATHLSPPGARRRATLHGQRVARGAVLGFREGGSHRIVDLAECPVLLPELTAMIAPLRSFIAKHAPRGSVDVTLVMGDQGVDVGLANLPLEGLEATQAALDFAETHSLARLTTDQGYGPEPLWEPDPVTVTLSSIPVPMPPGTFIQATADAEQRMIADACDWIGEGTRIADLFAGLGTFAFAFAAAGLGERKVLAVEADRAAHDASKVGAVRSGGRVLPLHRDLFRAPLQQDELAPFNAVLLDPPRAGAKAQIAELARSNVERVVYVSCNPSSWARDAAALIEGGYRLECLRPIGQFRWSVHVELASLFVKG
jgi:23S rRNA (uracil1939-C5)-methyltransferase